MYSAKASHHASSLTDIRVRSSPILESYYLILFMVFFCFQIQRQARFQKVFDPLDHIFVSDAFFVELDLNKSQNHTLLIGQGWHKLIFLN